MTVFHRCGCHQPLRDCGVVEFAEEELGALAYRSPEELLGLIGELQRTMSPDRAEATMCRIAYREEEGAAGEDEDGEGWMPVSRLFGTIADHPVSDCILHRRFTAYMQPVVWTDGGLMGYEFLLRPLPELPSFRPAELFSVARDAGLHTFLDREARSLAVRLGAVHLPPGVKRFVNFLPSSIYDPASCLEHTFRAIRDRSLDPGAFVFEIVETERLDDVDHLARIADLYRAQGIRLALDDVGAGHATLSVMDRLQPEYVKLDRRWIAGCHADAAKQRRIDEAIERAARFDGQVIAEGVESEPDWRYLTSAGIPLLQGYLFGAPAPVPHSAAAVV